jgi:hypothetical protein
LPSRGRSISVEVEYLAQEEDKEVKREEEK